MNPKSSLTRLKFAALGVLSLVTCHLSPTTGLAQSSTPTQGIYINGVSNKVDVAGASYETDVLPAKTTNYFNLQGAQASQANTNLWPKVLVYDSTKPFNPSKIINIWQEFKAHIADDGNLFCQWAVSPDNAKWNTNAFTTQYSANGTAFVERYTNWDSGAILYVALNCAWTTNAADGTLPAKTNWFISGNGKPGL